MKLKLFFLLLFVNFLELNAQCGIPPPLGFSDVYSVDLDNDGFATFDIGYYITNVERPNMENIYGVSSSGYNFVFYNSNNQLSNLNYTNISIDEFCTINYEYTGSGSTFNALPPCYWMVPTFGYIKLIAIPFNSDKDGDGILNVNEDSNFNLNLMDDDDDNDGIINLNDPTNTLELVNFKTKKLNIFPNPIENNIINFESNVPIISITVYDLLGKQLINKSIENSNSFKLDSLKAGMYLVSFQTKKETILEKIIVK